jgi:uncharacterized protein with PIN domain
MSREAKIQEITFMADCMLGRLARWLRICGFDTVYSRRMNDPDLMQVSQHEKRLILTRDRDLFRLCRKKNLRAIFILDDALEEQLKQVFRELDIQSPPALAHRCLDCNEILQRVEREKIEDRVPAYVLDTEREFHMCPKCRKVFWPGTHWLRMRERVKQLFGDKV